MTAQSLAIIAEFKKDGRKATVVRDPGDGYLVCKSDPTSFSGTRTAEYSTREKAVINARRFVENHFVWTKGRPEQVPALQHYKESA